jgi:hypothetical protein
MLKRRYDSFNPAERATVAILAFGAVMTMMGSLVQYYHLMA